MKNPTAGLERLIIILIVSFTIFAIQAYTYFAVDITNFGRDEIEGPLLGFALVYVCIIFAPLNTLFIWLLYALRIRCMRDHWLIYVIIEGIVYIGLLNYPLININDPTPFYIYLLSISVPYPIIAIMTLISNCLYLKTIRR